MGIHDEFILKVSWEELRDLRLWSDTLHPSEFLSRVYARWPHLRPLLAGTTVKVVAE
jgi:hypothetical protein